MQLLDTRTPRQRRIALLRDRKSYFFYARSSGVHFPAPPEKLTSRCDNWSITWRGQLARAVVTQGWRKHRGDRRTGKIFYFHFFLNKKWEIEIAISLVYRDCKAVSHPRDDLNPFVLRMWILYSFWTPELRGREEYQFSLRTTYF